jgi:trk system potassium uptake protein TrkA
MRVVFVGSSDLTRITAQHLLKMGFEVVIIEKDKNRIDEMSAELDAGFIHGDGSKPAILREADPIASDLLFCLTNNDQSNILTSLVGRSLGFKRVVTRIEDPSYEHICVELGLKDVIVPDDTIARYLADMCEGRNQLGLSALIKDEARIFSFYATEQDEGSIADLNLPEASSVMFLYRKDKFMLADNDTSIKKGDEVVVIAHSDVMSELEQRWSPKLDEDNSENESL